eukprot:Skav218389  [mRNA]  locus=scaffold368:6967:9748:+ [translate_table: standard]
MFRACAAQHSNLLAMDMEWVPDRSKHQNNPVALIQLAVGDAVTKLVMSFDSADRKKLQSSFGLPTCEGARPAQAASAKQRGGAYKHRRSPSKNGHPMVIYGDLW